MKRRIRPVQRGRCPGLAGPGGLIAAVIAEATNDAMGFGGDANLISAWGYLASDTYQHHLHWLGLPDDWRPEAIEQLDGGKLLELSSAFLRSRNGTKRTK